MRLLAMEVDTGLLAVVSLVGFVSYHWVAYLSKARTRKLLAQLPGPKPHPIMGNSGDIKGGFAGFLETMHLTWPKVFGEIYCWYVGSQVNVTISSPELMETILKSQKILDKGVDYNWYHAWLEQGLLVSKADKWRARRKILTPAFHFKILDDFVEVFNKQSKHLCQILDKKSSEGLVDIYPLMTSCTLDIIGETATGTNLKTLINGESEYAKAVHRMLHIITARTTKPWLANDYIFPLTPTGREHDRLLTILHGFINDVIRNRRAEIKRMQDDGSIDNRSWRPLLDVLLETNVDGQTLSDQDIREEIGTFMFGGHDTTSASMTWFLYVMAKHPEHQQLVWDELNDIFGDEDRDVTVEDIANLKYLDFCVKECLRMYPAAPLIERMATEDVKLGDYIIPEGSNILMLIYGMHRNPRIFPEPDKFDPERFFPENCIGRHPFAYIPFSAGPRNCIGQRFALTEFKVVVSNILRRFKLELSPDEPTPIPSYQVVLKPLNGLRLILTPRQ